MSSQPTTRIVEDKAPTLEELQAEVGGFIEVVPLPSGSQLIVNEEFLFDEGLGINWEASAISSRPIMGNAVVLMGGARLTRS